MESGGRAGLSRSLRLPLVVETQLSHHRPLVLYATRLLPYTPGPGAATRSFHLLRAASRLADVIVVGSEESSNPDHRAALRRLTTQVYSLDAPAGALPTGIIPAVQFMERLVDRFGAARPLGRLLDRARAFRLSGRLPGIDSESALVAQVRQILDEHPIDAAIVEHQEMATILRALLVARNIPSIADLHNVMHAYEGRLMVARRLARSDTSGRVVAALARAEADILRSYSRTIAVSALDASLLEHLLPGAEPIVVRNGVDSDYFRQADELRGAAADEGTVDTVLFTGLLHYKPNVDAVMFFVRDVLPLIRRRRPAVRLVVVGRGPVASELARAARHGVIELRESVSSVLPYFARAKVSVTPLRLGSGTRLKILESLAAGCPMVSTTIGAEGLDLVSGRDLLLADTPEHFAGAVVRLLEDRDYARALAAHGRATVSREYDWRDIERQFQQILAGVLAERPGGRS